MQLDRIHRLSGIAAVTLSLIAFVTVLTGFWQKPQADEGTGAHIFQLAIVLAAPTLLVSIATTDWKRPRAAAPLFIAGTALALAFGALYYLEHFFWVRG